MNPAKNNVNLNWETLFIFIPGLNIWASWRINKLRRSLLFFLPVFFFVVIFSRWMLTFSEDVDSEFFQYLLSIITFAIIIISTNSIIHFVRKWSKQWNENVNGLEQTNKIL